MATTESETNNDIKSENSTEEVNHLSDIDYLHTELAKVHRKLEVMHLALEKSRQDHKSAIESKNKDVHKLSEQIDDMQSLVDQLKYEKERLLSKVNLREIDMAGMRREIDNLKSQLEAAETKAKKREKDVEDLISQEQAMKEAIKDELKEEMNKNTEALHGDMLAILKEVQAEKKDVAAILHEVQSDKLRAKGDVHKTKNKLHSHKNCH